MRGSALACCSFIFLEPSLFEGSLGSNGEGSLLRNGGKKPAGGGMCRGERRNCRVFGVEREGKIRVSSDRGMLIELH
jgi:hypothetical protein